MAHQESSAKREHTSPWTEVYFMHNEMDSYRSMPYHAFATDEQLPTHDALSDVYNPQVDEATEKRVLFL